MFRVLIAGLFLLALPSQAVSDEYYMDCFRRMAPKVVEQGLGVEEGARVIVRHLCLLPAKRHSEIHADRAKAELGENVTRKEAWEGLQIWYLYAAELRILEAMGLRPTE